MKSRVHPGRKAIAPTLLALLVVVGYFCFAGVYVSALPTSHHPVGLQTQVTPVATSSDTLINLVQWREEDGGNGNWYAVLPGERYWVEAHALAVTLEHEGQTGYLATVTSEAENDFILTAVIAGTNQPSVLDMFFLGGEDAGGRWTWTTGEAFGFVNWSTGEPNNYGIETALGMWGHNQTDPRRIPGKWNNSLPDSTINPLARFWAVVEWGELDTTTVPPDTATLINLVQWSAAAGGNDHWYAVLTGERYWVDAHALAGTFEQDGMAGYLATVTSPAENDFILSHVIAGVLQPSVLDMFFLGGRDVSGWIWMTGEPFIYENWSIGEPNNQGIETALGMWGQNQTDPRRIPGRWNNSLPDATVNPLARFWSLIEWGEPDTTVSPPVCGNGILEPGEECDDGNLVAGDGCDPFCQLELIEAITLMATTDSGDGTLLLGRPGSIIFSIAAPVQPEIAAFSFPLIFHFSNGNIIGPVSEGSGDAYVTFSEKAHSVFEVVTWNDAFGQSATDPDTTLAGCVDFGGTAWSGSGEIWRLTFTPLDTGTIQIDSITVPPGVPLEIIDLQAQKLPFNWEPATIRVIEGVPTGDVDGSPSVTAADLVYLVNFVFKEGPVPVPCEACGDVDCSGEISAADLIALINYMFRSGTGPCNAGDLTDVGIWTCP